MTKLRDDLRTAFEREQNALGEVGDTQQRLLRQGVATREPAGHGLRWAAGVAAVLIAAVVITTFVLVRSAPRPHATPAATPTPPGRGLTVSESTPILLYDEQVNYTRTIAITWDGKPAGQLPFVGNYTANPAGTLFASAGQIVDRDGAIRSSGSFGAKFFSGTWADDETDFCLITPFENPTSDGVPTTLWLVDSRVGLAHRVASLGTLYNQTFMRVAACSVEFDRAVVVQSSGQGIGTAQYWVVQISTGKILWTHSFQETNSPPIQVVSARDGQTVAETDGRHTTLFGLDGEVVGHLAGSVQVFCWDGSLALVDPGTGNGPALIVRVSDGSTVWSGPKGQGLYVYDAAAQPDGADIAVGLHDPANIDVKGAGGSSIDLFIVAPDGHVVFEMKDIVW
jgi:hypothetical protein